MTNATKPGEVGDTEQFNAEHPPEVKVSAEDIESAAAAPATDDWETTSPGWDAAEMPKRDKVEDTAGAKKAEDTTAKLLEEAGAFVVANPLKAVAYGVVAGVVLGRML